MKIRDGIEPLADFVVALDDEPRRFQQWRPSLPYQYQGYYARHLQRYLDYFPKEQLRVYKDKFDKQHTIT